LIGKKLEDEIIRKKSILKIISNKKTIKKIKTKSNI
jgi:hypothetical protein